MSGSERQVVYKLGNKLCVYSTYVVKAHDNKESVHVAWNATHCNWKLNDWCFSVLILFHARDSSRFFFKGILFHDNV